jgi:hypothetical protein
MTVVSTGTLVVAAVRGLLATLVVLAGAAGVAGCAASRTGDRTPPAVTVSPTGQRGPAEPAGPAGFLAPPSSAVLDRALHTDLCALLDESALAGHGWQPAARAETLTSCVAASADQRQTVTITLDTAVTERAAPAEGGRCIRVKILDPAAAVAVKIQVRGAPEPCPAAEELVAVAAQRFAAGAGEVPPPDPWLVLDACRLLAPLLTASAAVLGGPNPDLPEVRRLGVRGCVANHEGGEVTLSVAPVPGAVQALDGAELAVAGRPARVRDVNGVCVLRLVGRQLGEPPRQAVQVITLEVQSATADRCAVATALAQAVLPALPAVPST